MLKRDSNISSKSQKEETEPAGGTTEAAQCDDQGRLIPVRHSDYLLSMNYLLSVTSVTTLADF